MGTAIPQLSLGPTNESNTTVAIRNQALYYNIPLCAMHGNKRRRLIKLTVELYSRCTHTMPYLCYTEPLGVGDHAANFDQTPQLAGDIDGLKVRCRARTSPCSDKGVVNVDSKRSYPGVTLVQRWGVRAKGERRWVRCSFTERTCTVPCGPAC